MSVLSTKLEMSSLAINAGRFDEAEKLIQDVLFEPTADVENKLAGWIAMGSIKSKMFNDNKASFDEVVYCFKKAIETDSNSVNQVLTTYFSILISVVLFNSELITAAKKQKGQSEDTARFNATVGLISGLVAINSDSSFWKAAGIAGAGISASNYVSNLSDAKLLGKLISDAQARLKLIFSEFGEKLELTNELKDEFRLKIFENPTIAKQLGYKDTDALSQIATDYSDLVISPSNFEKKIKRNGLFSLIIPGVLKKHVADLSQYTDKVYFALEEAYAAVIFTDDILIVINTINKISLATQLIKIPYNNLDSTSFRCYISKMGIFNIEINHQGNSYTIKNPIPISASPGRESLLAQAIENAFN
jgi:hypothetical protein